MEEAGAGDMVVDRFHCWLTRVHGVRWETNDPRPPSDHQSHPDHPASQMFHVLLLLLNKQNDA